MSEQQAVLCSMQVEVRATDTSVQATVLSHWYSTYAVGLQGKPVHLFESEVKLNYMRKINSSLTEVGIYKNAVYVKRQIYAVLR